MDLATKLSMNAITTPTTTCTDTTVTPNFTTTFTDATVTSTFTITTSISNTANITTNNTVFHLMLVASKLYGVNATIIIFVFVLYARNVKKTVQCT